MIFLSIVLGIMVSMRLPYFIFCEYEIQKWGECHSKDVCHFDLFDITSWSKDCYVGCNYEKADLKVCENFYSTLSFSCYTLVLSSLVILCVYLLTRRRIGTIHV